MKRIVDFRLLLITDRKLCADLQNCISQSCSAGVKAVQIREKDLAAGELLTLSKKIRNVTGNSKLIINNRYDIAILAGADGVHSPEKGITPSQIKDYNLLIGRSVHSVSSAIEADRLGFDYLLFGPVYQTPAKVKYGSPQGLDALKLICESVKIPVFAVGGINPNRAKKCIQAGAYGAAVISEIMKSEDIIKSVQEFKSVMGEL
jgi:thiamine-phosphate pyrophosphorylase